jgi:hypothetical protein
MKQVIILIVGLCIAASACKHGPKKASPVQAFHTRIFQTELDQFGYDIYKDSVLVIHQPIIPGAQGNKGFASKEDANKTAKLIIYKLDHGIMPPSITVKELDSLKVAVR